jgi:hypothetical protein
MADDFYADAARNRANQLDAEMAAANADLVAHKANGDYQNAGQTVQHIADLQAQRNNLATLWNQHVAAQQPQQAQWVSDQERHAKPPENMDWRDALDVARTSRYGRNINENDPYVRAGYNEVLRRQAYERGRR